jgi:uncharacterized protein with PIN domain
VNHYLLRFIESGRDAQRGKQPRDLIAQLPNAEIESLPGRLYVSSRDDLFDLISSLHGLSSFSPCIPCAVEELETALSQLELPPAQSFRVSVKRFGDHDFSSLEVARKLARLVQDARSLRVDLHHPDVTIGVEIRDRRAWLYHRVIPGIDRRGPPIPMVAPDDAGKPRFVADQMLGRLAAWLRMLGFDTTYVWDIADSELVRRANAEGRIVLTRDRPLSRNQAVRVWFVEARAVEKQVREVVLRLGKIPRTQLFQRCALCNSPLHPIDKEVARARVPASAFSHYDRFAECRSCDKIYWAGGHYRRVTEVLADLLA